MKYRLLLPALLLAGCQTTGMTSYGFKEGATVTTKSRDVFECRLAATQQVPVNTQIETTPTYTTPTYTTPLQTTCNGTSCVTTGGVTTGGQIMGGQTYSYDANAGLREEFIHRCLAGKGYRFVDLPKCASGTVPQSIVPTLAGKLRAPREGACVAQIQGASGNVVYAEELAD